MSNYILEHASEFERLEKQSQNKYYDYESELSDFLPKIGSNILDAGCGSGVVSRFLARKFPHSKVTGCDFSGERIRQASSFAETIGNLDFKQANLLSADFEASTFDSIVCRYVLEHLKNKEVKAVLTEFHRCLRPGGTACLIDIDGYLYNMFPQSEFIEQCFSKIKTAPAPDFNIGRQLPKMIADAGFTKVRWRIETMQFQGEELKTEIELISERFVQAMPFLEVILGNDHHARRFVDEYLETLRCPNSVLFYNKFIVTAEKQGLINVKEAGV